MLEDLNIDEEEFNFEGDLNSLFDQLTAFLQDKQEYNELELKSSSSEIKELKEKLAQKESMLLTDAQVQVFTQSWDMVAARFGELDRFAT